MLLDCSVWVIGTTIGYACYISPRKLKAIGAKVMEVMGEGIYDKIADECIEMNYNNLAGKFVEMSFSETRHAIYFKEIA
jgi:hypothetical protein